jgi:hypothetical protein
MTRIAVMIGAVVVPGAALAHPDHFSEGSFGLGHYFSDPFHLMLTVAAIGLYFAARRFAQRRRSAQRISD